MLMTGTTIMRTKDTATRGMTTMIMKGTATKDMTTVMPKLMLIPMKREKAIPMR